ncbi:MAG: 3-isopropylmalate dehydratase small subunit [bacterium]|jgi:3-isopropylmalate/(R)-2-methylmalate dehydratase small subunit|nr:3-isopropylmalate dehydratase small subunit [candidate division KSB1 bacterium]MDH7560644.1 3-isopropylmalate dehydratase small subunit [bacterium]
MSIIRGRAWKYGDDVNTDVIFPGKYTYTVTDPKEMARVAMEDLDPRFAREVQPGDVVVGGKNFGCGSSREQAAFCLKYTGVGAVIAKSFSRLYFRNCINAGLPAIQCPEAVAAIEDGQRVEVDLKAGLVRVGSASFAFPPLPPEVIGIFEAGGLIPFTRKRLGLG